MEYQFDWTDEEWKAIGRLRKAIQSIPESIRLYTTNGGVLYITRIDAPTDMLLESINVNISSGTYIEEMYEMNQKGL